MQIKRMRKRWGSLSANGMLTLKTDLIRSPRECIDYVVVHELSHLRYKNHDPKFYGFLDKVMPDWKKEAQTGSSLGLVSVALFHLSVSV